MLSSKYLSYLLRHHPEDEGLTLDEFGWCNVDDLLNALNVDQDELDDLVYSNTRFIYSGDKKLIKAAHGHSVPIKYSNTAIPPDILYHGTATRFLPSIRGQGLKKMTREAVHLSESYDTALMIGSRHASGNESKTTVLRIDTKKMIEDGYQFYKSEDGVWLVDSVPPKYII